MHLDKKVCEKCMGSIPNQTASEVICCEGGFLLFEDDDGNLRSAKNGSIPEECPYHLEHVIEGKKRCR
jgi:hypothetical protein